MSQAPQFVFPWYVYMYFFCAMSVCVCSLGWRGLCIITVVYFLAFIFRFLVPTIDLYLRHSFLLEKRLVLIFLVNRSPLRTEINHLVRLQRCLAYCQRRNTCFPKHLIRNSLRSLTQFIRLQDWDILYTITPYTSHFHTIHQT